MAAGRPTKLTPQMVEETKKYLPKLVHLKTLADCLGVHPYVLTRWVRRGEKAEQLDNQDPKEKLYIEFSLAIKKGLADAKINLVDKILRTDAWQAWAWALERRWPEEWGSQVHKINDLTKRVNKLEKENGKPGPAGTANPED